MACACFFFCFMISLSSHGGLVFGAKACFSGRPFAIKYVVSPVISVLILKRAFFFYEC